MHPKLQYLRNQQYTDGTLIQCFLAFEAMSLIESRAKWHFALHNLQNYRTDTKVKKMFFYYALVTVLKTTCAQFKCYETKQKVCMKDIVIFMVLLKKIVHLKI